MRCPEAMRVQAYFDGEVDAVSGADIEHHIERCAACRALLQDLEQTRTVLRRDSTYMRAPPALRAEVTRALDEEGAIGTVSTEMPRSAARFAKIPRQRSFWAGALSGAGGAALAASLLLSLWMSRMNPLVDELVNAHIRSLMPAHLVDVISTDKHTVKPWFAGHADVSPVVADFEARGFRLIGGRADYVSHQRSAVVVYQYGSHIMNVFSWAGDAHSLPSDVTRNGYHFACWKSGDIDYCAVSDAARPELLDLARLLQELGTHDGRETGE